MYADGLIQMGRPSQHPITVCAGDWRRTFAPGDEVVVGRDVRAAVRLAHFGISRFHMVLRYLDGRWVALDNESLNGIFVEGRRVHAVDIRNGVIINVGNPEGPELTFELPRERGGLDVYGVSVTVDRNRTLLEDVSFAAGPATLTAVIGPSGAGKSTLSRVITGGVRPNGGTVSFEGHDLHAEYASMRSRIGMVPQGDVVHHQLTINQALGYTAALRMPPDVTEVGRRSLIAQVLEELELTPHADTRIANLSGGQRKRVSIAMELLTSPSLLVLDEPTTGLDPALDRQVMSMLRSLADAGRVIVVVTHSLDYLDVCDQVLLLAPGGKTAFCGPPSELGRAMGSTDWADIFTELEADPNAAHRRFRGHAGRPAGPPAEPENPAGAHNPAAPSPLRQFSTLARRQVRLTVADRRYLVFLLLLPFIVGLLPLAVAGHVGFAKPSPDSIAPFEPKQVLVFLNLGAIFLGTALTIRELVGERAIFRREQAAGLSASAYVMAKIVVFGAAAVVQSAILVLLVTAPGIGKPAPPDASALGSPLLELFVGTAATCVAAAVLGLAVSALAHNSNQVLPLMAVTLTAQLVLAGGFIPVTDRALLDPISWFTPARWGLAATASTADLSNLVAGAPKDSHWRHTPAAWYIDVVMLGALAGCYACFVRWKLRLKT
jgi:ABC transport system ATP-binding/permease protein